MRRSFAAPFLLASIVALGAARHPDGAAATGARGVPAAAPIPAGVYYGVRTNLVTGQVIKVYMTFLADGRVFNGYPKEGLDVPTRWERECRYHPCGTYTRSGERVVMHWNAAHGDPARDEVFRLDAQDVLSTDRRPTTSYRRVQPLNGPLEGRYGVLSSRENYTSTEISFHRDGTVSDERVLWWTTWDSESAQGTGGDAQVVRRGTYTVRNGTLRLQFEDGTSGARFIMVPPGGDLAKSVQIGGNYDYLRIPDLPQ